MIKFYSINGQLVDKETASIKVNDLVISRGFGIFDFLRLIEDKLIFVEDHIDRFYRSAEYMGLEMQCSKSELRQQFDELIKANGLSRSGFKMILTGGYSLDGYAPTTPNLILLQLELKAPSDEQYANGVRLMLHKHVRELAHIKTTNYTVPILQLPHLKNAGYFDVLYYNENQISESSRSNFFIVNQEGSIVTPKEDVLFGITRMHVIDLAKANGFEVIEKNITLDDLKEAKEAFMTSSTKGVLPVSACSDITIADGKAGPVTQSLMTAWTAMLQSRYGIAEVV